MTQHRKVVAAYFLSLDGVAEAPDRFLTAWDDETDASGAVVFCGVPAGQLLVVTQPRTGRALLELTMSRGTILGRAIRTSGKSN